jgi:hypothetical protein
LPEKSKTEIIQSAISHVTKESQTTNTDGRNTDKVRITFQLPKGTKPVELDVQGENGSPSLSFIIPPDSEHSIELPPGNYKYIVRDRGNYISEAPPPIVKTFTVVEGEPILIPLPPSSLLR